MRGDAGHWHQSAEVNDYICQQTRFCLCVPSAEGYGKDYLIVSFGLDHSLASPRLIASSEPYPNRWTHHAAVFVPEDIDAELMGWIREAYDFSASKR